MDLSPLAAAMAQAVAVSPVRQVRLPSLLAAGGRIVQESVGAELLATLDIRRLLLLGSGPVVNP